MLYFLKNKIFLNQHPSLAPREHLWPWALGAPVEGLPLPNSEAVGESLCLWVPGHSLRQVPLLVGAWPEAASSTVTWGPGYVGFLWLSEFPDSYSSCTSGMSLTG